MAFYNERKFITSLVIGLNDFEVYILLLVLWEYSENSKVSFISRTIYTRQYFVFDSILEDSILEMKCH